MANVARPNNRYKLLIEKIFFAHWKNGVVEFVFARKELKETAEQIGIELPDNLGDVI